MIDKKSIIKRLMQLKKEASSLQAKVDLQYFFDKPSSQSDLDKLKEKYNSINRIELYIETIKIN